MLCFIEEFFGTGLLAKYNSGFNMLSDCLAARLDLEQEERLCDQARTEKKAQIDVN
jgi:hypothetical protein